jgi:hypothetical protein
VLANYYQNYRREKRALRIILTWGDPLAKYLLTHLEEFQAQLKDYMALPWPD